jgi:hypothetical protein
LFWLAAIQLVHENTPDEAAATGQSLLSASVGGVGAAVGLYVASLIVGTDPVLADTQNLYWVLAAVAAIAALMSVRLK